MRQMFHVKTWRRCSAHYVYARAIAKKEKGSEIDASPQLPISTGVQSLERSRLPWSVPLDRSRLPGSAIMAVQVQSTDVFLCYQRLRVSCALCNNFQAARPRQTERRLAPLYVEHMPSIDDDVNQLEDEGQMESWEEDEYIEESDEDMERNEEDEELDGIMEFVIGEEDD